MVTATLTLIPTTPSIITTVLNATANNTAISHNRDRHLFLTLLQLPEEPARLVLLDPNPFLKTRYVSLAETL